MYKTFRKYLPIILLAGLCIWYFDININMGHDWGGDFSQYIHQAINIAQGKPIAESSYIVNPDYEIVGPITYPNGFPLLLSGVYLQWGNSIEAFLTLMAIFCVAYIFLCYFILRQNFGIIASLLLTFLIMLNPPFLDLKGQVVSDIPFSAFFLTVILLLCKSDVGKTHSIILAAIFTAYAIFIRSMGWSIVAGMIIYYCLHYKEIRFVKNRLLIFAGLLCTSYLLLTLLFPSSSGASYLSFYQNLDLEQGLLQNIDTYIHHLNHAFPVYFRNLGFIQILLGSTTLVFSAIGFILNLKKKPEMWFCILFAYVLSGLLYPANLYFRFFVPIMPLLFLLAYQGAEFTMRSKHFRVLKTGACLVVITALFYNVQHASRMKYSTSIPEGPQSEDSREAFTFLKNNAEEDEAVGFIKPRVLALYTGLPSFSNNPNQKDMQRMWENFNEANVKWLLDNNNLSNPGLHLFLDEYGSERVFQNSTMRIYKLGD